MANLVDQLSECTGFEWDRGNLEKNWLTHKVAWTECEETFFNQPLLLAIDSKHSSAELRFYALGHTDAHRYLFLAFTIRKKRIRVISARDMNRKERKEYENAQSKETGE